MQDHKSISILATKLQASYLKKIKYSWYTSCLSYFLFFLQPHTFYAFTQISIKALWNLGCFQPENADKPLKSKIRNRSANTRIAQSLLKPTNFAWQLQARHYEIILKWNIREKTCLPLTHLHNFGISIWLTFARLNI